MDNSIAVCKSNCNNEEEFWSAVAQLMRIFTEQDYQVLFRHEDCDVYIIEIAHDQYKDDWGCDRLMKVTADEAEHILLNRDHREDYE